MTPRRRYLIAFFGLGWLVAVGLLFQYGLSTVFHIGYGKVADSISSIGQFFSDAEGDALRNVRRTSRADYMEPIASSLTNEGLRKPARTLFGVFDGKFPNSFEGMEELETKVRYKFPIISFYVAWGDKANQGFPTRMVQTIDRMGSVPMITWEPWVVDFDESRRTNLPPRAEREYASLAAIARGDYDFYVTEWASSAARFKKPIFLRFAHEMNDPYRYPWGPQNGNRPDDFIAAWRHVHLIFQKMSATNVVWVWSPHISMPWFEYYYPGDEYVDWLGIGILNYGNIASWSRWWSLHQILEKAYPALTKFEKPIMICEFGTLASGGDIVEWYRQAFYHLDHTYGRVKAVVFFNQKQDTTMSAYPLNWSPIQSPRASLIVSEEVSRKSAL